MSDSDTNHTNPPSPKRLKLNDDNSSSAANEPVKENVIVSETGIDVASSNAGLVLVQFDAIR